MLFSVVRCFLARTRCHTVSCCSFVISAVFNGAGAYGLPVCSGTGAADVVNETTSGRSLTYALMGVEIPSMETTQCRNKVDIKRTAQKCTYTNANLGPQRARIIVYIYVQLPPKS